MSEMVTESNQVKVTGAASPQKPNIVRETWQLLRANALPFVLFECLYKVVGALVMAPLLLGCVNLCMWGAGLQYLAPNNMTALLTFPLTWVCVVVLLLLIAFYALVEVSACVLFCQLSRQGVRASAWAVTKAALRQAAQVFKRGNRFFVVVMVLVLPLTNVVLGPSFVGTLEIPDFIVTFILYKPWLTAVVAVVFVALMAYAVRLMYSFHFHVLLGQNCKQARLSSRALGRGHWVLDALRCLGVQVLYAVVAMAVFALLAAAVFLLGVVFQQVGIVVQVVAVALSSCVAVAAVVVGVIVATCSAPLCYAAVSVLYFRYREAAGEPAASVDLTGLAQVPTQGKRAVKACLAGLAYVVAVAGVSVYYMGVSVSSQDATTNVGIVAHRCGANYAPENTVAALNKAANMGATWCEIDVQMCADGSIIVTHDTNLERTAGLDANTWDVTYDQVKSLDSGSKFSADFAGEPIPLLEDMIKAAKARGVKLQIEIKPTGHDEGIEQRVAEIVRANGFQDQCYLASMSYDCLQKIRACGSDIRVLYIMALAYGDIAAIPEADAYSVESLWATEALAENVHSKAGAELCAWTTNSQSFMETCIAAGVDQLVTDEVALAESVVSDERGQESFLLDLLGAFRKTEY